MNKIEEILQSKETYDPEYPTISIPDALEAMKEFGKICFEAGRENNFYINEGEFVHKTYEDFLKEIEDGRD